MPVLPTLLFSQEEVDRVRGLLPRRRPTRVSANSRAMPVAAARVTLTYNRS